MSKLFNRRPPMVAADLDDHRRRTYVWLRRTLVFVTGIFLVTIFIYRLVLGHMQENSISAYYFHDNRIWPMRDIFLGTLSAMGIMLMVYQGYRDAENYALNIGGLGLICVAFFPMKPPDGPESWVDKVHYGSAVIFFLAIIYVVLFRARDTLDDISDARRSIYVSTYYGTGFLMIAVLIGSLALWWTNRLNNKVQADWLLKAEFLGVAAFWVFWIVKTIELENSKIDQKDEDEIKSAIQQIGKPRVY